MLHLADLGFKQISVEPVVAQPTDEYALKESDLPVLFDEYDRLAAEMVKRNKAGNGFNFFHFMIDLEGGPCVYKRLSGCGSGTEYLAVTPWGDYIHATSLWAMRTSLWVMSGMASRPLTSRMSLSAVMFMPRKNVATVLPDSIAAVAVPPTHTTSTAQSLMPMI